MAQPAKPQLENGVLVIYTDGGSRGNPGPAASGWTVGGLSFGKYIGIATNNDAEYQAITGGLQTALQLLGKAAAKKTSVEVRMDSELACKQLNHEYRLKDPQIQKHFIEIWNLMLDFSQVRFVHVRREFNKEADAAVNKALDEAGH
jgi:ribonuclease HI